MSEPKPASEAAPQPQPQAPRTFSMSATSVERVILLAAFFAAPVVTVGMLASERRTADALGITFAELLQRQGAAAATALTIIGALLIIGFVPIYLQYRGKTTIEVGAGGFRVVTPPFLPLGLLARDVRIDWDHLQRVQYRQRRRLLSRRPELVVESAAERVVLPLTDVWERTEAQARPPVVAKPPDTPGGWADHPLVQAVQGWQVQSRAKAARAGAVGEPGANRPRSE
jgi:hypothetical protein